MFSNFKEEQTMISFKRFLLRQIHRTKTSGKFQRSLGVKVFVNGRSLSRRSNRRTRSLRQRKCYLQTSSSL